MLAEYNCMRATVSHVVSLLPMDDKKYLLRHQGHKATCGMLRLSLTQHCETTSISHPHSQQLITKPTHQLRHLIRRLHAMPMANTLKHLEPLLLRL